MLSFYSIQAVAVWSVPRICKTNAALPSRYLNQVVVQVGGSEESAYFTVVNFHVDVQLPSGSARGRLPPRNSQNFREVRSAFPLLL